VPIARLLAAPEFHGQSDVPCQAPSNACRFDHQHKLACRIPQSRIGKHFASGGRGKEATGQADPIPLNGYESRRRHYHPAAFR
jgi:hypothetical protein